MREVSQPSAKRRRPDETDHPAQQGDPPRRRARSTLARFGAAAGLFFLAPVTAEYLIGYDENVGRFLALLAGLAILGPLYGGAALIIREVARRSGWGWPSLLLLAAAFGVFQAGLVDQSLFNTSYRDIDYWDDMLRPTFVPALGVSAYHLMTFVVGHVVWSIGAPIAVVESLVPARRSTPWLGRIGLTLAGVLYLAASLLIFADHVKSERFLASAPQLAGAGVAVLALIWAAVLLGRRRSRPPVGPRRAPRPLLVGLLALTAAGGTQLLPPSWVGVAIGVLVAAAVVLAVGRWSRRAGWRPAHVLALAGGAVMANAVFGFLVQPFGEPSLALKLAHNVVLAVGMFALLTLAAWAVRRSQADVDTAPDR
ncbi:hypothetical protein [Actinopolymorpha pittospori]